MTVQSGSGSRPTMYVTQLGAQPIDAHQQALQRANAFSHEIGIALADKRLLVLRVQPKAFGPAVAQIAKAFSLRPVSIDALFVEALREVAAQKGIDFAKIYAADAAWPDGPESAKLRAVLEIIRREHVTPALLFPAEPILVSDWGLLFRYDMLSLYTELRDACGSGAHPGALCVLPADDAEQSIVLDGHTFPEFDQSRVLPVPSAWLRLTATATIS